MNDYNDPDKREDDEPLELERNNIYDAPGDLDRDENVSDDSGALTDAYADSDEDGDGEDVVDADDADVSIAHDVEIIESEEDSEEESIPEPEAYDEPEFYEEASLEDESGPEPELEEPYPDIADEPKSIPAPIAATPSAGIDVSPGASVERLPDEAERVRPESFGILGMSLFVLVALAGCALRVLLYLKEPALWLDEAMLTMQILAKSYGELAQPLAEHHSAPIGFLLASKLMINLIGTDELGLRAFPLGASIVGLLATALLARRTLPVLGAVLAIGIAAISWPAIGYGAELKQYSSDLMAASIMFVLGYGVLMQPSSRGRLAVFAIAGAALQWFSLPVLFVLAGVGLVAGLDALIKGDTRKAGGLALVALVWAGSFAGNWYAALQHTAGDATLRSWHHDAFLMFPPERSWPAALKWLGWTFMDLFENPVGLVLPGLGMVGFVSGLVVIGRRNLRWLVMLLMPFAVLLAASYLQRYPVYGRFAQFLVPALVVIIGAGLGEIVRLMWTNGQRTLATVLVFLVFVQPIALATNELLKPGEPGVRPVVEYLSDNYEAGDGLYLQQWVRDEYAYHAEQLDGVRVDVAYVGVSSRNDWSWYAKEIASLGGNDRVWFVILEDDSHLAIGERKYFETELDRVGTRLDMQQWGDYWLYAYDLSGLTPEPLPVVQPVESPATPEAEVDDALVAEEEESAIVDTAESVEPAEIE